MTFLRGHKTQPIVFRLFLVTVLVAAHCCVIAMSAHAESHGEPAVGHMSHAAVEADASITMGDACCDSPAPMEATRSGLSDDTAPALIPVHNPFAEVRAGRERGLSLRAPPDHSPAPRALLQHFQI